MQQRDYKQNCGVARSTDLLGERWTFLIVRDLLISPRRFSELEKRLKGIGTNLLSKRLKEMRGAGLVVGGDETPYYTLTEMGCGLEPIILHLVKWSNSWIKSPTKLDDLHFPDWDLLGLKALYVPDLERKRPLVAQFAVEDWMAWVRIDKNSYTYGLGKSEEAIDINFPCLISELRQAGAIIERLPARQITAAKKFVSAFPLT